MATGEHWVAGSLPCTAGSEEDIDKDMFPTPPNAATYAQKPLPPLPLNRRSLTSSFSSEVNHAFTTPKSALDDSPLLFAWEREGPGISVMLHQQLGPDEVSRLAVRPRQLSTSAVGRGPGIEIRPHVLDPAPARPEWKMEPTSQRSQAAHRHTFPFPRVDTEDLIPMVPPDEILSPQPRSSMQKILKLTGNVNLNAPSSRSTDSPTLHNSPHKIQQLTGLDFRTRRLSANQLRLADKETQLPALSSETSSGSNRYSKELSEDESYEPTESSYSLSYVDSINVVNTPLGAPRFAHSQPRPCPSNRTRESSVVASSSLSDSETSEAGGLISEELLTPIAKKGKEPWCEQDSDTDSLSSSSSDQSATDLELEPTAGELYHDTAISIAKSNLSSAAFSRGVSPPLVARNAVWDNNNNNTNDDHRDSLSQLPVSHGSTGPSTPEPGPWARQPPANHTRPFSLNSFRKKPSSSLSERRGRVASPLEAITTAPSGPSSTWTPPQRTPYPPVSSSIRVAVEEAEDNQTRFSLLARLFTGGGSSGSNGSGSGSGTLTPSGSGSGSMGKRDSAASGGSDGRRQPLSTVSSQRGGLAEQALTSAWSPDTPPGSGTSTSPEEHGSTGILARTLDHARHAAGLRTKAEKMERKRESLREKIKVLKSSDESESRPFKGVD